MTGCIVGCQYIPSVQFFAHAVHHGIIWIEAHEHFQKKTWRNKTAILGIEDPLFLSVPLKKGKHQQKLITEVEISYDEPWHKIHAASIQSAYGKTAFYQEIREDIQKIYTTRHQKLWYLNMAFIDLINDLLPAAWDVKYTISYTTNYNPQITDLRQGIEAGNLSPLDPALSYPQVNRLHLSHMPNLSILDVLCHLGPDTYSYLKKYANHLYTSC